MHPKPNTLWTSDFCRLCREILDAPLNYHNNTLVHSGICIMDYGIQKKSSKECFPMKCLLLFKSDPFEISACYLPEGEPRRKKALSYKRQKVHEHNFNQEKVVIHLLFRNRHEDNASHTINVPPFFFLNTRVSWRKFVPGNVIDKHEVGTQCAIWLGGNFSHGTNFQDRAITSIQMASK